VFWRCLTNADRESPFPEQCWVPVKVDVSPTRPALGMLSGAPFYSPFESVAICCQREDWNLVTPIP
jgi:hypothetical protein